MLGLVAGGQEQWPIVDGLLCFQLFESGIEGGNDSIVMVHHRADDGLKLALVVEDRLVFTPDAAEPAARQ